MADVDVDVTVVSGTESTTGVVTSAVEDSEVVEVVVVEDVVDEVEELGASDVIEGGWIVSSASGTHARPSLSR